jgi:outer membrane protein assembly factor BamE (lipoprotein component of BamABCDE complex)
MKKSLKLFALILAIAMSSACGVVTTQQMIRGHNISKGDVKKIQKGVTTEREVLGSFGPPSKVRDTEDGKEFLYEYTRNGGLRWNLIFSVGGGSATKTLMVWLDKKGIVTDYAYKSS